MPHTQEECEKLVFLADKNGCISYAQIAKTFNYDSEDIYDWIGDTFTDNHGITLDAISSDSDGIMLYWKDCPDDYVKGYQFKPDDIF